MRLAHHLTVVDFTAIPNMDVDIRACYSVSPMPSQPSTWQRDAVATFFFRPKQDIIIRRKSLRPDWLPPLPCPPMTVATKLNRAPDLLDGWQYLDLPLLPSSPLPCLVPWISCSNPAGMVMNLSLCLRRQSGSRGRCCSVSLFYRPPVGTSSLANMIVPIR